jgi:hypothetical protein
MNQDRIRRTFPLLVAFTIVATTLTLLAQPAAAQSTPPDGGTFVSWVNHFRTSMGLRTVGTNASWSEGARLHSCWMLRNGMSHDEQPGTPGYTTEGDLAGNNGNVAVSSGTSTNGFFTELWMTGPFHAIPLMHPGLHTVGGGRCDTDVSLGTSWRSAATLDVLSGVDWNAAVTTPITFPGNGATIRHRQFITETPDPRSFCGLGGTKVGVPLVVRLPESSAGAVSSLTGPNGPVTTCTLTNTNTTGTARDIMGTTTVVVVPHSPYVDGTYTATVTTGARTVRWSFNVNPSGVANLATTAIGTPVGFTPITPARVADSRHSHGLTRLATNTAQRLQLTGTAGIPAGTTAASLNVTAVSPDHNGFLTAYPCGTVPDVSTLNYTAGSVTANSTIVPLDSTGGVCVNSSSATHIVIDVTGFLSPGSTQFFNPITPTRALDTRTGFGGSARVAAGGTVAVTIDGVGGVPAGAPAAAVNIVAVNPSAQGFLTAFPCGATRPNTSSLNYVGGAGARANNQLAALGSGRLCIYTSQATDIVVDVTGHFGATGRSFQALRPVRVTDTRNAQWTVSAGYVGAPVPAGATARVNLAGQFGIPSNAVAVSGNLVAASPNANGFLTAHPASMARPNASSLNYTTGSVVANGGQFTLGAGGVDLYTFSTTHLILDISGAWL